MPELGDFVPELICLGVDAVICAGLYHAYSSLSTVIQAAAATLGSLPSVFSIAADKNLDCIASSDGQVTF
jgi:hypothetical protein